MHSIVRLEHNQILLYVSIFIVCLFTFTRAVNTTPGVIFGIVSGMTIIYLLYNEDQNITNKYNVETEYKLEALKQQYSLNLKNFIWDANMINLFFSAKDDLGTMDPKNFKQALKNTDSFLKCFSVFNKVPYLENDYETFQVAEEHAVKALNYIHSFIYNIKAESPILDKHQEFIHKYRLYSKINLDFMKSKCDEKNKRLGLYNSSSIITDYDTQKAVNKFEGDFYFFT